MRETEYITANVQRNTDMCVGIRSNTFPLDNTHNGT
jgi:hypothetical protein